MAAAWLLEWLWGEYAKDPFDGANIPLRDILPYTENLPGYNGEPTGFLQQRWVPIGTTEPYFPREVLSPAWQRPNYQVTIQPLPIPGPQPRFGELDEGMVAELSGQTVSVGDFTFTIDSDSDNGITISGTAAGEPSYLSRVTYRDDGSAAYSSVRDSTGDMATYFRGVALADAIGNPTLWGMDAADVRRL